MQIMAMRIFTLLSSLFRSQNSQYVDYLLLNWNYLIKELQEWQSLGMAIEQAQTA